MRTVIDVQNLGKLYRLGKIGTGTISHDLKRWWALSRGKADPFSKIGKVNDRAQKGDEFEYVWALNEISFKVKQGDIVGVIGKNGAGKSTLLKILSRITAPSTGDVKIKGRIGSLLEVGTGFHPEMTGRENVYMNGTILGMRRHEITKKFDDIVDFAGVARYIDTPVKRYSSGMMVRLGFAVAAFLEPEILIVDEVLAVGDAEFQKRAIGKMQDVSRGSGRTVLFVSHNIGAIKSLCTQGLLLVNGSLAHSGSIEETLSAYQRTTTSVGNEPILRWPELDNAPGDEELRIRSMAIANDNGIHKTSFESSENITLTIDFEILSAIKGGRFMVQLITPSGEIAFATTNHNIMGGELDPGCYKTTCCITKNLLNFGRYFIRVHSGIPGQKYIVKPQDFLSIDIVDSVQRGSFFHEKWPGVVAPSLQWSLTKQST